MNVPARFFRLVWGGDVDRALRPVLAVGLIGSIAGASSYPFLGSLQVRHAYGDATMWMCVACVGVIAGITGLLAARGHDGEAVGSLAT
jgi:hypothetical protein